MTQLTTKAYRKRTASVRTTNIVFLYKYSDFMGCAFLLFFLFAGCCIFHKKKRFGESDSDESDSDVEEAKKSGGCKKNFLRHHA